MASLPLHDVALPEPVDAGQSKVHALSIRAASWKDCLSDDLLADWAALCQSASEPNPFFEPWFLIPSLKALDPTGSVKLVAMRENGALRALVPLQTSASYYGHPIPHWRIWLHDNAFCGTPVVQQGFEFAFWSSLLAWADSNSQARLFLHLAHMPEKSLVFNALLTLLAQTRRIGAVVDREERAMLQSDLDSETYFETSMSGKKRKELRRQHNRLAEHGELVFHRLTDASDIVGWIDRFLALEAAGWKGREHSALASHKTTEQMFHGVMEGAAQAGKLERLALHLGGRPIAMLANFRNPPAAFSFKTAFDETYARFSPGVLLQRENLALLDDPAIGWTDSCAAQDHPMIERIWREKRSILRLNIGLGGPIRRAVFTRMIRREKSAHSLGDM